MLDMGFVEEITNILNALPKSRQAMFFSATLPQKIKNLINQYLQNPIIVEVKTGDTAKNILQDVVRVRDRGEKFNKLQDILNQPELKKVLIFTETKRDVEKLALDLSNHGHKAESIHGNKRQSQRERSLSAFRNDQCKILVATDVAARGLDIGDISHVINYTVPNTYDDYCHRIGRTGRGDKSGKALTFVE
jgi:superfamily II DNA/RNA helicase